MIIETRSARETYELGLEIGKKATKGHCRTNQQPDFHNRASVRRRTPAILPFRCISHW